MTTSSHLPALLALAALLQPHAVQSDDLGVLFTTPAQRAALDSGQPAAVEAGSEPAPDPGSQGPSRITLNGTLISSVGRKQVWLNDEPGLVPGRMAGTGLTLLPRNRVQIHRASSPGPLVLKPGQTVDLVNGNISESYSDAPADITSNE